jgi:hypothetical protein
LDWRDVLQKLGFVAWCDVSPDNAARFADWLFKHVVKPHPDFINRSLAVKLRACRKLCNASAQAFQLPNHGAIAFSCGRHITTTDKNQARPMRMSNAERNVAEILIKLGYFRLVTSKPPVG